MKKIAAVVVTYNRSKLLKECLDGLLKSTKKISAIYIIDNASTDDTQIIIRNFALNNPGANINNIEMRVNAGGAGGFSCGMQMAFNAGYDYIWVMDDDVEPAPDCLENLCRYLIHSECIQPRRLYVDGKVQHWEAFISPISGLRIELNDNSFSHGKDFCFVNTACFEGMLISRELVDKIGFPDPDFFIVYDDTSYGLLASKYTNICYVRDAILFKKINKEKSPPSPLYVYHVARNYGLRQKYLMDVYGDHLLKRMMPLMVVTVWGIKILIFEKNKIQLLKALFKGWMNRL